MQMLSMTDQMNLLAQVRLDSQDYLRKQDHHSGGRWGFHYRQPPQLEKVLCDHENRTIDRGRESDENLAVDRRGPEQATPSSPRARTAPSTMFNSTKYHQPYQEQQQRTASSLLTLWLVLVFAATTSRFRGVESTEVECNFEKYIQGCFSQANFVCDIETNRCRCHHSTPILIDGHFCVKRAKPNESCQYHAQCDNERGYYCLRRGPSQDSPPIECQVPESLASSHAHKCRCLGENGYPSLPIDLSGSSSSTLTSAAGHNNIRARPQHSDSGGNNGQNIARKPHAQGHAFVYQQAHRQHQQQDSSGNKQPNFDNYNTFTHQNNNTSSILSRLVWSFLLLILAGLIILLLLIKYQSFRTSERPFHLSNDRLSINSEPDVPPPYEVAIRMKD